MSLTEIYTFSSFLWIWTGNSPAMAGSVFGMLIRHMNEHDVNFSFSTFLILYSSLLPVIAAHPF
jgi:hypothetical protein